LAFTTLQVVIRKPTVISGLKGTDLFSIKGDSSISVNGSSR
jgi:hypothetical protein